MTLFVNHRVMSHSGLSLPFKIECDALSNEDIWTLACIIGRKYQFSQVYGIPRGGERLANNLRHYYSVQGGILIVDDVFTTGKSMEEARRKFKEPVFGVVIFARGECPSWIKPVFQLAEWARP